MTEAGQEEKEQEGGSGQKTTTTIVRRRRRTRERTMTRRKIGIGTSPLWTRTNPSQSATVTDGVVRAGRDAASVQRDDCAGGGA